MPAYRARDLLMPPNLLSAARIPLAVAFPFAIGRPFVALGVLAAAALTDVLDGFLARRLHEATPIGAVVDGVADKAFAGSVLGTLLATGLLSPVAAVLLATRELGELPLAIRLAVSRSARAVPLERRANALGKAATTCEFATVVALVLGAPVTMLWIGATAVLGAAAAASYWAREIRAARAPSAPPARASDQASAYAP